VKNAFAVSERVAGSSLAIIDDVMTTGSTVDELARACRKAGAASIEVWTAARAV
jgi:predicted amidophosphoribosyltransferase